MTDKTPLTAEQLEADKKIIAAATSTPWLYVEFKNRDDMDEADIVFLCRACTAWPQAIAALEEARESLDLKEDQLKAYEASEDCAHEYKTSEWRRFVDQDGEYRHLKCTKCPSRLIESALPEQERLRMENAELSSEVERLRAALAFYADEKNYRPATAIGGKGIINWFIKDNGARAREALGSAGKGKEK